MQLSIMKCVILCNYYFRYKPVNLSKERSSWYIQFHVLAALLVSPRNVHDSTSSKQAVLLLKCLDHGIQEEIRGD